MQRPIPFCSNRRHQRGVALIITLAAIVLLTMLALAFFTHSQLNGKISFSSAGQARADFVAESGLHNIQNWLLAEITANSTANQNNGITIYQPINAQKILPERVLAANIQASDSNFYNVVKMSLSGSVFYNSGSIKPAMNVSTSTPSANGRSISTSRWLKPVLTFGTDFPAPDWIPLHGYGIDLTNSDTNTRDIVGRFAYVVYDVGGLIDINVAGNQLSTTGGTSGSPNYNLNNAKRGRLNQIDLSVIPGIKSTSALAKVRNPTTSKDSNFLLSGSYTIPGSGTYQIINNLSVSGTDDQPFVNRQDLINFANSNSGTTVFSSTNQALPYLTVFSREKNAPTFNQTYLLTGPTITATNSTGANAVNPDLLAVRFYSTATIGNETIVAGTPIVRKRFPLSRINLLTNTSGTNIQKYFGLAWNSGSNCWIYAGPTGNSPASSIETLDQVAQEKRDPNFFELLKATIKVGSLGGYSAPAVLLGGALAGTGKNFGNSSYYGNNAAPTDFSYYDTASLLTHYMGVSADNRNTQSMTDLQIIQIGANIIDQYDSDDIPTSITFSGNTIYGVENLPYINKIIISASCSPSPTRTSGTASITNSMFNFTGNSTTNYAVNMQFEYWNPHYNLTGGTSNAANFQIKLNGNCTTEIRYKAGTPITNNTIANASGMASQFNSATSFGPITSSKSFSNNLSPCPSLGGTTCLNPTTTTAGALGPIINIAAGTFPANSYAPFIYVSSPSGLNIQLQCDIAGKTYIYQSINNITAGIPALINGINSTNSLTGTTQYPFRIVHYLIDPRTTRYGPSMLVSMDGIYALQQSFAPSINGLWKSGTATYATNCPPVSNASTGVTQFFYNGIPASLGTHLFAVSSSSPYPGYFSINNSISGTHAYYADNDGAVRGAAGYYYTPGSSLGLPLSTCINSNFPVVTVSPEQYAGYFNRPIVLNRPFRSVGELGFAFRDQPWKNLDFFTYLTADAGLLDVFCLDDADVIAGKINLNTKYPPILQAMLQGGMQNELNTSDNAATDLNSNVDASDGELITPSDAANLSNAITQFTGTRPFWNKSELVTQLNLSSISGANDNSILGHNLSNSKNRVIKERREAAVRALAEAGQTRTWNLMIDIIAQSGRYGPAANGNLGKFTVEGEKRYWLHLAIDRYTGEIIDSMLEPVSE